MILTDEQKAILAHVVLYPQAWADHAVANLGEWAVLEKIESTRAGYEAAIAADGAGYKSRLAREPQGNFQVPVFDGVAWVEGADTALILGGLRVALITRIDADTDAIYGAILGKKAEEYLRAETDAMEYKAAGYTGSVPPSVASWATPKAQTARWAADDIITTATAWRTAQGVIRENRLARKEAARNAVDAAALATVQAQWSGFLSVIKPQLGL